VAELFMIEQIFSVHFREANSQMVLRVMLAELLPIFCACAWRRIQPLPYFWLGWGIPRSERLQVWQKIL